MQYRYNIMEFFYLFYLHVQLDKYGKPNESTPSNWKQSYTDYGVKSEPLTNSVVESSGSTPNEEASEDISRKRKRSGDNSDSSPNTSIKKEKKKKKKKDKEDKEDKDKNVHSETNGHTASEDEKKEKKKKKKDKKKKEQD